MKMDSLSENSNKFKSLIGLKWAHSKSRPNDSTFTEQKSFLSNASHFNMSFSSLSLKSKRFRNATRFISTKLTRNKSSALTPQSKTKFKAKEQHNNNVIKSRPLISSPRAVSRKALTPIQCPISTPNRMASSIDNTPLFRQSSRLWIESITEEVANTIRELLSVSELKRQEAIFELLTGEIDLCYDLGLIETTYQNSLLNLEILDGKEAFQIFGDLHMLYCVHSNLIQQIEAIRDNNGVFAFIGAILVDWIPKLNVYESYCANQRTAKKLLEQKTKSDRRMSDFLERCLQSPFSRRLDLWAFLDFPRTRLVKYPLLFRAIRKYTSENSSESNALEEAIGYMERLISRVDYRMGETECKDLLTKIDYNKGCANNICVSDATAILCSGQLKSYRGTKLLCFLFNTCFVLTRVNEFGNYELYRQPLPIDELRFEAGDHIKCRSSSFNRSFTSISNSKSSSSHFFRVYSSARDITFTLQASDDHCLKMWFNKFKQVCRIPSPIKLNAATNARLECKITPNTRVCSNQKRVTNSSVDIVKRFCNEDSFNEMLD